MLVLQPAFDLTVSTTAYDVETLFVEYVFCQEVEVALVLSPKTQRVLLDAMVLPLGTLDVL